MTDPTPEEKVEGLIADLPPAITRHALVKNPELVEAVAYTLDKIKAGQLHVSLKKFYETKLQPTFGGPRFESVCTYIREVLKRNHETGKAL